MQQVYCCIAIIFEKIGFAEQENVLFKFQNGNFTHQLQPFPVLKHDFKLKKDIF